MDTKVKVQVIKSVTAVICAAGLCFGAAGIADKSCKTNLDISSKTASSQGETDEFFTPEASDEAVQSETAQADDTQSADTAVSEDLPADDETAAVPAESAQEAEPSGSGSSTPAVQSQPSGEKSSVPQTKAEIIKYCNNALNSAKAAKPGFTKKYVMDPKGPSEGVVKNVLGIVTKNETKTYKKGSDITDVFPAAEHSWSSKLREQDVVSADLKVSGQYYDIMLRLGKEENPQKGEASSYGRVMSVIDAQGAASRLPGIKNVNMLYHDGYVHAIVDSKTGRLQKAEFSATADVSATIPVFGDVAINNIVSTETFTDFVW